MSTSHGIQLTPKEFFYYLVKYPIDYKTKTIKIQDKNPGKKSTNPTFLEGDVHSISYKTEGDKVLFGLGITSKQGEYQKKVGSINKTGNFAEIGGVKRSFTVYSIDETKIKVIKDNPNYLVTMNPISTEGLHEIATANIKIQDELIGSPPKSVFNIANSLDRITSQPEKGPLSSNVLPPPAPTTIQLEKQSAAEQKKVKQEQKLKDAADRKEKELKDAADINEKELKDAADREEKELKDAEDRKAKEEAAKEKEKKDKKLKLEQDIKNIEFKELPNNINNISLFFFILDIDNTPQEQDKDDNTSARFSQSLLLLLDTPELIAKYKKLDDAFFEDYKKLLERDITWRERVRIYALHLDIDITILFQIGYDNYAQSTYYKTGEYDPSRKPYYFVLWDGYIFRPAILKKEDHNILVTEEYRYSDGKVKIAIRDPNWFKCSYQDTYEFKIVKQSNTPVRLFMNKISESHIIRCKVYTNLFVDFRPFYPKNILKIEAPAKERQEEIETRRYLHDRMNQLRNSHCLYFTKYAEASKPFQIGNVFITEDKPRFPELIDLSAFCRRHTNIEWLRTDVRDLSLWYRNPVVLEYNRQVLLSFVANNFAIKSNPLKIDDTIDYLYLSGLTLEQDTTQGKQFDLLRSYYFDITDDYRFRYLFAPTMFPIQSVQQITDLNNGLYWNKIIYVHQAKRKEITNALVTNRNEKNTKKLSITQTTQEISIQTEEISNLLLSESNIVKLHLFELDTGLGISHGVVTIKRLFETMKTMLGDLGLLSVLSLSDTEYRYTVDGIVFEGTSTSNRNCFTSTIPLLKRFEVLDDRHELTIDRVGLQFYKIVIPELKKYKTKFNHNYSSVKQELDIYSGVSLFQTQFEKTLRKLSIISPSQPITPHKTLYQQHLYFHHIKYLLSLVPPSYYDNMIDYLTYVSDTVTDINKETYPLLVAYLKEIYKNISGFHEIVCDLRFQLFSRGQYYLQDELLLLYQVFMRQKEIIIQAIAICEKMTSKDVLFVSTKAMFQGLKARVSSTLQYNDNYIKYEKVTYSKLRERFNKLTPSLDSSNPFNDSIILFIDKIRGLYFSSAYPYDPLIILSISNIFRLISDTTLVKYGEVFSVTLIIVYDILGFLNGPIDSLFKDVVTKIIYLVFIVCKNIVGIDITEQRNQSILDFFKSVLFYLHSNLYLTILCSFLYKNNPDNTDIVFFTSLKQILEIVCNNVQCIDYLNRLYRNVPLANFLENIDKYPIIIPSFENDAESVVDIEEGPSVFNMLLEEMTPIMTDEWYNDTFVDELSVPSITYPFQTLFTDRLIYKKYSMIKGGGIPEVLKQLHEQNIKSTAEFLIFYNSTLDITGGKKGIKEKKKTYKHLEKHSSKTRRKSYTKKQYPTKKNKINKENRKTIRKKTSNK